jgi:CTP-dependent riboflavin kinase
MKERNSKRGNKIQALENDAAMDYEETQKKIVELNRKIDKKIREIESEQIYVHEVAQNETAEYLKDKGKELKTKESETISSTMKKETKEIKVNKK